MQTNTKDQVYAGFFVRLTAFLIDMIIVSVALAVIRVPMWFVSLNNPDNVLVRNFIFQYFLCIDPFVEKKKYRIYHDSGDFFSGRLFLVPYSG